jgi:hypothetical protein
MGDRIWSYYDCPKCKKKDGVEIYDAYSSMLYVEACKYCDYKVDKHYFESEPNVLVLISKKEAFKRGYFCKNCNNYLYPDERKEKLCEDCKGEK